MLPVRHDVNMDKSLSSQRWLARLSFLLAGLAIVVLAVFGGLIIFFLVVEPEGLNRLWRNIRNYFRVWPFSY